MSSLTEVSANICPRCQLNTVQGDEVFYHRKDTFKFNVDLAMQIASDGREPVEVDEESLRQSLLDCIVTQEHLPHVNLGRPGIIADVTYVFDDGQQHTGHLLIDGNHRAARSLQDGLPFYAYVLTKEETARTLMRWQNLSIQTTPLSAAR